MRYIICNLTEVNMGRNKKYRNKTNVSDKVQYKNPSIFGKVNCNKLNVRLLPEVGNNILDVIDKDSSVTIIDELEDFYKIRLDNGSSGYVMKEFIDLV